MIKAVVQPVIRGLGWLPLSLCPGDGMQLKAMQFDTCYQAPDNARFYYAMNSSSLKCKQIYDLRKEDLKTK